MFNEAIMRQSLLAQLGAVLEQIVRDEVSRQLQSSPTASAQTGASVALSDSAPSNPDSSTQNQAKWGDDLIKQLEAMRDERLQRQGNAHDAVVSVPSSATPSSRSAVSSATADTSLDAARGYLQRIKSAKI